MTTERVAHEVLALPKGVEDGSHQGSLNRLLLEEVEDCACEK